MARSSRAIPQSDDKPAAAIPVLDSVAQNVASKFGASVVLGRAAAPSLYQAQRSFIQGNGYAPYLMHGYAFTKIQPPRVGLALEMIVAGKLQMVHESCVKAAAADDPGEEKAKRGWDAVLNFLSDEMNSLWRSAHRPLTDDSTEREQAYLFVALVCVLLCNCDTSLLHSVIRRTL